MTVNGTCAKCGATGDLAAVYSRGYWWHVGCCVLRDDVCGFYVDFPSTGKIIPATILHEVKYEGHKKGMTL